MERVRFCIAIVATMALVGCSTSTGSGSARSTSAGILSGSSFEAVVVGTIHKSHLTEPGYPLPYLAGLIETYKPDLILVEIRPEPFKLGHFEDGPFEMTYVTWLGQNKGIMVSPIDWFRDEDIGREPEPEPDDKKAFEEETAALEAHMKWPLTFAEVHSPQQDTTLLTMLNIQARYLGGNSIWNRRQAWFHRQALEAIRQHGAHKVLAFVGAFHRPELEAYLAAQGGSVRNPRSIPFDEGDRAPVPAPVVQLWRDGAERLRTQAAKSPAKIAEALTTKAIYFDVAANHGGQCCVEPAAFKAPASK